MPDPGPGRLATGCWAARFLERDTLRRASSAVLAELQPDPGPGPDRQADAAGRDRGQRPGHDFALLSAVPVYLIGARRRSSLTSPTATTRWMLGVLRTVAALAVAVVKTWPQHWQNSEATGKAEEKRKIK